MRLDFFFFCLFNISCGLDYALRVAQLRVKLLVYSHVKDQNPPEQTLSCNHCAIPVTACGAWAFPHIALRTCPFPEVGQQADA